MAKRLLFIEGNTDGTVGGSYFVLLDLVRALDREQYHPIVGFHQENYLMDAFREAGAEVVLFPNPKPLVFAQPWMNRLLAPVKKLVNVYRGVIGQGRVHAQHLREHRVDLLNLNNSITRNHAWMWAALRTGTPCLTHEMGINSTYSRLSRYFGRRMGKIVCVSDTVRKALLRSGIDYPNITVIHCGIDLSRYHLKDSPEALRRKHGVPEGVPVIGVVGNIREWKGQETLVRATAMLKQKYPQIRCLLVGACGASDQAYGDRLHALGRELQVESNVIYTGFQRNAIDYMELMDVVTHTSIHPEPFGIVTLEAMSRSRPFVSTTIGGPTEVVEDGHSGLLVDPGQPEALAAAIDRLLSDPVFARSVGENGNRRMHDHFSMQRNVEKTAAVYREVLSAAGRG